MFQTKEQDKTLGGKKSPNEMEINNLPDKAFKEMVIEVFIKLRWRVEEHSENFNKKLEIIKKNQLDLKNTITEMKNTVQGIKVD